MPQTSLAGGLRAAAAIPASGLPTQAQGLFLLSDQCTSYDQHSFFPCPPPNSKKLLCLSERASPCRGGHRMDLGTAGGLSARLWLVQRAIKEGGRSQRGAQSLTPPNLGRGSRARQARREAIWHPLARCSGKRSSPRHPSPGPSCVPSPCSPPGSPSPSFQPSSPLSMPFASPRHVISPAEEAQLQPPTNILPFTTWLLSSWEGSSFLPVLITFTVLR